MALQEELVRSGNWLFRWRSYLPLIVIALFIFSLRDFEYIGGSEKATHLWEIFCMLISYCGLAIRAITIGHTPRGTSGRNTRKQVAETLNTAGIYSITRNPLYLGNFVMGLGIALFAHLWWLTLIYILIFWLYYERIIFAEESFLRVKFGDEYLRWAEQTPPFLPKFKNYRKSNLRFSLKNVLKREYNGFFAVIVVMFVLEVVGEAVAEKHFEIDRLWAVLLGAGFVVFITLRTLRKKTSLLDVKGR